MLSQSALFILRIPVILLALTVHEYCHGWVAWLKGDSTARDAGRLTFNPFAHLDIFGTLMLLFGPFGWAKPVPVNPYNLDNPRRDSVYVSLAGPVSNIVLALAFGFTFRILVGTGAARSMHPYAAVFFQLAVIINLGLSFFNLIPIPPLDGSKILMGLLPPTRVVSYLNVVQHAPKVFLILILAEWGLRVPVFSMVINPLWKPYFTFWQFIIFGGRVM
ncbi:MAG: site-2 protease family protein [Chitinivibrionales bacterium]|nr:site-2 protease family protein [Chitinivibrionales bacterium]MBD3394644.1 site-2 protease family protein [Chitinivibrionales bacterium]